MAVLPYSSRRLGERACSASTPRIRMLGAGRGVLSRIGSWECGVHFSILLSDGRKVPLAISRVKMSQARPTRIQILKWESSQSNLGWGSSKEDSSTSDARSQTRAVSQLLLFLRDLPDHSQPHPSNATVFKNAFHFSHPFFRRLALQLYQCSLCACVALQLSR